MEREDSEVHGVHAEPWYIRLMQLFSLSHHPSADGVPIDDDDYTKKTQNGLNAVIDAGSRLVSYPTSRQQWYKKYASMDKRSLIRAVLDLYAAEVTQPDYDSKRIIWVESKDENVQKQGDDCLVRVRAEERAMSNARRIAKYGDLFAGLNYVVGQGVMSAKNLNPVNVTRVEDEFTRLLGFKVKGMSFRGERKRDTSWPWDILHFRRSVYDDDDGMDDLYGVSILRNMYESFTQLELAENAVLLYRLRRAPDRNLIKLDVGSMDETEAAQAAGGFMSQLRNQGRVSTRGRAARMQYNTMNMLEDVVYCMRKGDQTSIETLSGSGNMDQIRDIDYLRDKFFGSAHVPKAYLGFEGDINAKATLAQQDIRFARTLKQLQYSMITGYYTMMKVNYALLGDDAQIAAEKAGFIVQMSPIAYLDEWDRLELVQLRYQIIDAMARLAMDMGLNTKVWAYYLLTVYAKLPEKMVEQLVQKAPEAPEGAGGQFEGVFNLTKSEREKLDEAIRNSPELRASADRIRALHCDDYTDDLARRTSLDTIYFSGTDDLLGRSMLRESGELVKDLGQNKAVTEDQVADYTLNEREPNGEDAENAGK